MTGWFHNQPIVGLLRNPDQGFAGRTVVGIPCLAGRNPIGGHVHAARHVVG